MDVRGVIKGLYNDMVENGPLEFVRDGQDMENEFMNFHACPKSGYETKCY